jgi:hypothetical protein
MTPKGILPVLHYKEKETEAVLIGYEEILQYLERNPKFQKFALPKKKRYQLGLQHCKEKFEPILDQLVDEAPNVISGALCKALLQELEWVNANLQGPFYCGNNLTWVRNFMIGWSCCSCVYFNSLNSTNLLIVWCLDFRWIFTTGLILNGFLS